MRSSVPLERARWGLLTTLGAAAVMVAVLGLVVGNQRTPAALGESGGPLPVADLRGDRQSVAGQQTAVPSPSVGWQGGGAVASPDRPTIKAMLSTAARNHGVNAGLVMGVAWWESGWNQSAVSSTGAIGIMQVEPYTADSAGPRLLGRQVDIHQLPTNIELGTAILKENLDRYHGDVAKALTAYYAGPAAVDDWGRFDPDVRRYVIGIYRLAVAFNQGTGPV